MEYIDMHCDTLMKAYLTRKKTVGRLGKCMVDLEKLEQGGCTAQFFAIFMLPMRLKAKLGFLLPGDDTYIEKLHGIMMNTLRAYPERIAMARNAAELDANRAEGKLSAFLTLEDGRAVDGKMDKLEAFYEKGIRLISLTWNAENCFGAPNSDDAAVMAAGLTDFGREAVRRMNELGMLVDVSHLSDGGFWDVAAIAERPFVASHSNCRGLSPHRRNLTDEMIRMLGEKGGVAGLNFGPEFLNADLADKHSRAGLLAAHARHMAKVGGVECVGIGSDFDGISGEMEISGADKMELLFGALAKAGFTDDEIELIAHKNVERVLRDALR